MTRTLHLYHDPRLVGISWYSKFGTEHLSVVRPFSDSGYGTNVSLERCSLFQNKFSDNETENKVIDLVMGPILYQKRTLLFFPY